MDDKYSWVQTHKELSQYLRTKENSQKELIELLISVGITPFNDRSKPGNNDIQLEEIDPFTFYCYIYKYGPTKRLENLRQISEKLNLNIPTGENGVPSAQAQKVWLFPYKYLRVNNEIERLWNLFNKSVENKITDEDFADALQIKSIGKTKLTEALFYIEPEKFLPINAPIKPYLKEKLGIDPEFNTYSEYQEILKQVKIKSDLPFYELSYEAWKWNDDKGKINYWIFQGNPKSFDVEGALRENTLTDWTVSAHKDKIKVGDKVIIWVTGSNAGCYALAEVTSEPRIIKSSPDDHLWKVKDKNQLKAGIKITVNLVDKPILKSDIAIIPKLKNLKVGSQGTNFTATEAEYQAIVDFTNMITEKKYWVYAPGEKAFKWEEFYEEGIMGLGWDDLGDLSLYNSKESIVSKLQELEKTKGSKKNDATANWEFKNVIKVGDIIIAKRGKKEYLGYGIVVSDYYYDLKKDSYQKCRKVDWKKKGTWIEPTGEIVLKTLTDITKYPEYVNKLINLIGIEIHESKVSKDLADMKFPLNTILYGPPGTGKTYNTILRAAEIIESRKIGSYSEALSVFKNNLHDQIEFITFHQNYSYEDFIQGLRPDTENDNQLTFERKDGVFKVIADRALKNLEDSEKPHLSKKTFEEAFKEFINPLLEGEVEEIEVKMK